MIHEFNNPILVVTPLGEGYAIYVRDSSTFENDVWTCCLCEGGDIKHFNTSQLKLYQNATFEIKKKE